MRAVVGLVDWRTGEIDSDGRNLMKTPTHRLAREGIVLIPQGDSLFPGLTVRDNLDAGAFAPANWSGAPRAASAWSRSSRASASA